MYTYSLQAQVSEYWRSKNMYVKGRTIPRPCLKFEEANFPGNIGNVIALNLTLCFLRVYV